MATFRNVIILLIVMLNAGCDQVSKAIVRKEVDYYEIISLIDRRLTLTKVENAGAFLSAGSALPYFFRLILLT
ncbi:MAG: signal peptidase II [Pedobacter sp.]|jgi:signal peptidase II